MYHSDLTMPIMALSFLRMFLTMTANSRGWWHTACKSKHTSEVAVGNQRIHPEAAVEAACSRSHTMVLLICISFILSTTLEFCCAIDCSILRASLNRSSACFFCSTSSNVKSSLWAAQYSDRNYVCLGRVHAGHGSYHLWLSIHSARKCRASMGKVLGG